MAMEISLSQLANFQPKQEEAIKTLFNSQCKYLLYGGAAGGGKSYFLRWAAVYLGIYYSGKYAIKNVPIGLFSEDYPTLKDRQIRRIKMEFPLSLGELKEFRDEGFAFLAKDESFIILLRNLDDPSKYASTEFAAECVEELTKNPETTFEDLRFRLRYPNIPDPKFVGATNPGEIGHSWVKKLWIRPNPRDLDPEYNGFFFVPAKVNDNKYIDESYVRQLSSLPDMKRKAFLDGSWDIVAGQVFDEWLDDTHVIRPFVVDRTWNFYGALDLGWNKPFSAGWYAVNPDGRTYLINELYGNSNWFERKYGAPLTARRLARILNGISKKMNIKLEYWVGDPAIWNKILRTGETKESEDVQGESYAEIMINAGLNLIAGDNDRKNGIARYREALSFAPDGKPWYQVFSTCYDTIRTIPALVYDKTQFEDVDTDGEDHCYDRDRYFFMSRPSIPTQAPKPETRIKRMYIQKIREMHGDEEGGEPLDEYAEGDY